jgi:hypothetical protein
VKEWNARIVKMGRELVVRIAQAAGEIQYTAIYADFPYLHCSLNQRLFNSHGYSCSFEISK